MRALTPLSVAVVAMLIAAPHALACDSGHFPTRPSQAVADVIMLGRVETVAETPRASIEHSGKASAQIAIERVARGAFPAAAYRLDWPAPAPGSCDYPLGPMLKPGERVALYLRQGPDGLNIVDWFHADEAVADDPRLTRIEAAPTAPR